MKNKITRRDFLKAATFGTASAIALSCGLLTPNEESEIMTDPLSTSASVLVLGAGIAGLAAAQALTEQGRSVIILEARNRVGGRMWTDSSLGVPLDLGASWIHGVNGNPITKLAKQFGVKTVPTDDENSIMFNADGSEYSDVEWEETESLFEEIYEEVALMQEETESDTSLQDAFDAVLSEYDLSDEQMRRLNYYAYLGTSL